jgi:hypothetical protein
VVGLNPVVGVLLSVWCHAAGSNSSKTVRVGRRLIGHDLARYGHHRADSPLEESTGRPQIAPWRDEHVDDLPELVDAAVQVSPPAGDHHIVSSTNQQSPTACRHGRAASASRGVNRWTNR